jgi:thiamine-phosphate pyrophosphorylase
MTDERSGEPPEAIVRRLPRGAGLVFRHHASSRNDRRAILRRLTTASAKRRIALVRAGPDALGKPRLPTHGGQGSWTWPAHDRAEAIRAVRAGARIVFVSPVFATRSHPGARPLGPWRAAAIVRGLPVAAIALGGMTPGRFRKLKGLGFAGWAGIDAWSPPPSRARGQKRKAVPT